METRFLEFERGPGQVGDYLIRVGAERGVQIYQRLDLLLPLGEFDGLPDPPIIPLLDVEGLFQFLVDYDGEVHRVAFGAHEGVWLLVYAFRCDEGETISSADVAAILDAWARRR
jgi:hypothetical protein